MGSFANPLCCTPFLCDGPSCVQRLPRFKGLDGLLQRFKVTGNEVLPEDAPKEVSDKAAPHATSESSQLEAGNVPPDEVAVLQGEFNLQDCGETQERRSTEICCVIV